MGGAYRKRRLRAAGLTLALAGLAPGAAAAPDAEQVCRRFPIEDARDGAAVKGPEDVVFDAANDRFLIAAFDRDQTTPDAAGRWSGGLFVLPRRALDQPSATVSRLPGADPDLRPHGIDIGPDGAVWAVHRAPVGPAAARSRIDRIAADGVTRWTDPRLCRANDVAASFEGRGAFVTLDRGACGGASKLLEEVFGLTAGDVVFLPFDQEQDQGGAVATRPSGLFSDSEADLDIPNGIAAVAHGPLDAEQNLYNRWVAIAESRGRRIRWEPTLPPALNQAGVAAIETPLPGGPDNLNRLTAGDDRILATAHDDLFRLFLHMEFRGLSGPPSSTVFVASPPNDAIVAAASRSGVDATPAAKIGLKIPGALYAGATAAAYNGAGLLVVGSAVETGLLVCGWTPPAR